MRAQWRIMIDLYSFFSRSSSQASASSPFNSYRQIPEMLLYVIELLVTKQ